MKFLRAVFILLILTKCQMAFSQITCDFTLNTVDTICKNRLVQATANETSSFAITSRCWDFTNSTTGITYCNTCANPNPTTNVTFSCIPPTPGLYKLTLYSANSNGDSCNITKNILVVDNPVVNYSFSPTEICPGTCVQGTCNSTSGSGTISSVQIDWGCGPLTNLTSCPIAPTTHCYTNCSPQYYNVTVLVTNSFGCFSTQAYPNQIRIIPSPVACFTADTTTANCASNPLPVTFTACNAGPNITYSWYINDTLKQSNTGLTFSHTFPVNIDCYNIKLVVSHPTGCRDSIIQTNYICNRGTPQVCFTAVPDTFCVCDTVWLTNCTPGLSSLNWQLTGPVSFTPTVGNTASYYVCTPGTYTATATGTFAPGCSATATKQILAKEVCPANFTIDNNGYGCKIPTCLTLHADTCPSIPNSGYTWIVQGFSPQTGRDLNYCFNSFGCRSVTLRVTHPNGCVSQKALNNAICIREINPSISVDVTSGCSPVCATFTDVTNYSTVLDSVVSKCWTILDPPPVNFCGDTFNYCFNTPGCYDIRMIVTTASGCKDTVIRNDYVCVGPKPNCTITASPTTLCFEASPVTFTTACADTGVCFIVNWGDGSPNSTICSPIFSHQYQDVGTFNTCITPVRNGCVADSVICIPITVHPPVAKFTAPLPGCDGNAPVCLTNQSVMATSYNWSFCNGATSTAANPCVVLPSCSTCAVTLTAYNSTYNCTHVKTTPINTGCGNANVSMFPSDTIRCVPTNQTTVSMTYTNTTTPSSSILSTRWDYDTLVNPPGYSQTGNSFTRAYSAGNYVVCMIGTTTSGCIDTVCSNLRVCRTLPNFTYNTSCFPAPICFTNTTTDANCSIVSYSWNFGDPASGVNNTSTLSNPCHNFTAPANYQVTLTVTNNAGCSRSITRTVTVSSPVNLNYTIDTMMCPTGNQHCIINNTTGTFLTYVWERQLIPNTTWDTFSTNPTPCYNITVEGDYLIRGTVSSAGVCFMTDTTLVHVCSPRASGTMSDSLVNCPNPPKNIQFLSTSQCYDSIYWSLGEFGPSGVDTVNRFFSYPGVYPGCLTVTTNDGCVDSACIGTVIVRGPYGFLTIDPATVCACKDSVEFTIGTVAASSLTLINTCDNSSYTNNNISPVGTDVSPSYINASFSFCLIDACRTQLVFGDDTGCIVYLDTFIYIDSPVVNFTFNSYGACLNDTVCFWDSTTYHLPANRSYTVRRIWYFGDNTVDSTSNSPNPCHRYPGAGIYNPKLYIWSNGGCLDSVTSEVVIIPNAPGVGFVSDSFVCVNSEICFQDTSISDTVTGLDFRIWSFGDSVGVYDTITTTNICHTYTTPGNYTVFLCVYDSLGCPACFSSVIHVIAHPVADAGTDTTICYGVPVTLNGTGGITCSWSPPSLVSSDSICNPVVQLYADATFTLIVSDQYQCKDTDEITLRVSRVYAGFDAGNVFCLNDSICFTDTSSSSVGTLGTWLYDFGDSTIISGENVCHKYSAAGNYTVTQTVTDNYGCVDTAIKNITLNPNPVAEFTLSDSVICSNEPLCITDSSTSITPIASWNWNYGHPGGNTNGQAPSCYIYPQNYSSGVFQVTLLVTDQNGCVDSIKHPVTVNRIPDANFTTGPSCLNLPTQLTNTSIPGDAALNSCEWTLWLGAPSPIIDNNCNTAFEFPVGNHDVQLIVIDQNGCRDTVTKTIRTDEATTVEISGGDTTICIGSTVEYIVTGQFNSVCWTPNTWLSDTSCSFSSAAQTISPLGNITYIVSADNGVCEPSRDTVTIHVIQEIPIEVTATPDRIVLGLSSQITSQIPGAIDSIIWIPDSTLDCRDCPNPVATPTQTTTYTAIVYYSQDGVTCTNSASVTITFLNSCDEIQPFLPNTFTPNGDGVNDVFMIRGIAGKKINYFRIFDRWGKLVFESKNGELNDTRWGWDGTNNGNKLNADVFVYTYEIECINGETNTGKGNVSLVR